MTKSGSARVMHEKENARADGAVAQLGEHLLCKQGVTGSIPVSSTIESGMIRKGDSALRESIFSYRPS